MSWEIFLQISRQGLLVRNCTNMIILKQELL